MTPSAAVAEPREEKRGGGGGERREKKKLKGGKIRAGVGAQKRPRPPTETERGCDPSYGLHFKKRSDFISKVAFKYSCVLSYFRVHTPS